MNWLRSSHYSNNQDRQYWGNEDSADILPIKMYLDTLRAVSEITDDYLYFWELQKNRIWFSGALAEKFDFVSSGENYCALEDWMNVIHKNDLPALAENLRQVECGETVIHNMNYRVRARNGRYIWINCRGKVQTDAEGQSFAMIGRVSDVVLRDKIDILTGMFNKVKLFEDLGEMLHSGRKGFLMILGVDNLKHINISHGWEYGNELLKSVADIMLDMEEDTQQIYRVDSDFFAICMPDAGEKEAQAVFDRIQGAQTLNCALSAGVVLFHRCSERHIHRLYQYAEDALDKAKQEGKNKLAFFSAEDYRKRVSTIALIEEMEQSILNDCSGFSLAYQAQVRAGTHQLYGAEALLRYESPTRGLVSPVEFIPLLEQTGLICTVGLWALEEALIQCREWRKCIPDFHMSVNLSYVQLKQPDIVRQVLEILKNSGVPGEALTLEVTESVQLQDFSRYNEIFATWKNMGISIAVDDFGTGYSSLGYLKHLEIDEIKIDRCFVSGVQNSSYNHRLISNMLELAAAAKMHVCCEGVEEREELQVLEELKPDLLQGYFFSVPCKKEEFEKKFMHL